NSSSASPNMPTMKTANLIRQPENSGGWEGPLARNTTRQPDLPTPQSSKWLRNEIIAGHRMLAYFGEDSFPVGNDNEFTRRPTLPEKALRGGVGMAGSEPAALASKAGLWEARAANHLRFGGERPADGASPQTPGGQSCGALEGTPTPSAQHSL